MKHFQFQELGVQQLVRNKILRIVKISTRDNLADIQTKQITQAWLMEACRQSNIRFPDADWETIESTLKEGGFEEEEGEKKKAWSKEFERLTRYLKYE